MTDPTPSDAEARTRRAPKELPFRAGPDEVRALLDGSKTQLRLPVKRRDGSTAPPYQPGDSLYVREACWQVYDHGYTTPSGECERGDWLDIWRFSASKPLTSPGWNRTWRKRSSAHMPKAAARIWLAVVRLRVERACDISDADARATGAYEADCDHVRYTCSELDCIVRSRGPHVHGFRALWISTYGEEAWNDACWVYTIKHKKT